MLSVVEEKKRQGILMTASAGNVMSRFVAGTRQQGLLRLFTCWLRGDGKIDPDRAAAVRLPAQVYEDQLSAVQRGLKKWERRAMRPDLRYWSTAASERDSGITIDVAYRYFHADAQVHHCRLTRPRAVHPKICDRRIAPIAAGDF